MMKQLKLAAVLLGLSLFRSALYADVTLQSTAEMEDTWKLQTSKNTLTDKAPVTGEDTWIF